MRPRSKKKKTPSKYDNIIISTLVVLIIFGLLTLASASSPVGFERFGDSYHFIKGQIINGIIPGVIAMLILMRVPYRIWFKYYKLFLGLTVVMLVAVFATPLAAGYGTSQSWIVIGPIHLQPAEFAKLTFIIGLAGWLAAKPQLDRQDLYKGLLPFSLILGIVCGLLAVQPDVGTMIIIALIAVTMFFVSGATMKHIGILGGVGVAGIAGLIAIAPYRIARLLTFINPSLDTQGAGYQLNQALIAVGSGGLLGLGLGQSRQKFLYLPEVTSDSIFAVMSEEMGFVVSVMFVVILTYFGMRMLKIVKRNKEEFAQFFIIGVVSWILIQSIVNIGAIIGIMPLTGVPLPFVSHGGSAMLSLLAAMGIVLNISADKHA